ncbi:MAG: metallophosphoesterase family protein [Nitrospirota bacterium]|nr:metallophosphoesterase family protein [Nitrospirota bacterium]
MSPKPRPFRIGVIADTHGLFDRAILRHFQGVDHILHAGDIGGSSVLEQLERIAPVTAVSGNVDGYEQSGFNGELVIELGGKRIALRHILYEGGKLTKEGRAFLDREQPDLCIFGHTHRQKAEWLGQTLLFNPGSAGPKRFRLTRGLGILTIESGAITPSHIELADRPEA